MQGSDPIRDAVVTQPPSKTPGVRGLVAAATAVYYFAYLVFACGWLSFTPNFPWVAFPPGHHLPLAVLLLAMLVGPALVLVWGAKAGAKTVLFSLIPAALTFVAIYVAGSYYYYGTREYRFDPFLQFPPNIDRPMRAQAGRRLFRIETIGGSTTFHGGMPLAYNYPEKLQKLLQARYPSITIDVLNEGQSWYTSKHSLINYTTEANRYSANLVIVMHGINDLYRSFAPADYALGNYQEDWSHYYGPAIHGANPPTLERYVIDKLTFGLVWYSQWRTRGIDYPLARYASLTGLERHLTSLVRYAKDDNAAVLLMTQPSLYRDDLNPDEEAALYFGKWYCSTTRDFFHQEYPTTKSLVRAMDAFNERTRRVARANDVALLDADHVVPKNLANFLDDVHYTDAGSTLLAQAVARKVVELGIVDSPAPEQRAAHVPAGRKAIAR